MRPAHLPPKLPALLDRGPIVEQLGEMFLAMLSKALTQQEPRYLRKSEFRRLRRVSRSTFWRLQKNGKLPPAIRLSDQVEVWRREDVERFLAEREEAA